MLLNKEHSISKAAQLIKGESSNWKNKNNLLNHKFGWQDDYWAVSISERHVTTIRDYIRNQEEHLKKKMFNEELDDFLKNYGSQDIKTGE